MVNGNIAAKNVRAKRQAHLKGQIGGRQAGFNSALGKAKAAKAGPSLRDQAAAHRAGKGTTRERLSKALDRSRNQIEAIGKRVYSAHSQAKTTYAIAGAPLNKHKTRLFSRYKAESQKAQGLESRSNRVSARHERLLDRLRSESR